MVLGAGPHDLAALEVETLELVAPQAGREALAVAVHEVDARVGAQNRDALYLDLHRSSVARPAPEHDLVRAHEARPEANGIADDFLSTLFIATRTKVGQDLQKQVEEKFDVVFLEKKGPGGGGGGRPKDPTPPRKAEILPTKPVEIQPVPKVNIVPPTDMNIPIQTVDAVQTLPGAVSQIDAGVGAAGGGKGTGIGTGNGSGVGPGSGGGFGGGEYRGVEARGIYAAYGFGVCGDLSGSRVAGWRGEHCYRRRIDG